jgi:hypothetical protein
VIKQAAPAMARLVRLRLRDQKLCQPRLDHVWRSAF